MKLHYFKQDALDYFKENIESNIDCYAYETNDWVKEKYRDMKGDENEDPFLEYNYEIKDFELVNYTDDTQKTDYENIKILYDHLMFLSETQAMDERLWAGLTHSDFYEYTQKRWGSKSEEKNMKKPNYIASRYFFNDMPKFRNTLCKLWWVGELTYDKDYEINPYHLTDVLFNRDMSTRINDLFTSNFSRNFKIVKAFLEAIDKYESKDISIDADVFRSTVQYVNIIGGIYLLDYLDIDELENMISGQIKRFLIEGPDVSRTTNDMLFLNDIATLKNNHSNKVINVQVRDDNLNDLLRKKINDVVSYDDEEYTITDILKINN